MSRWRDKVWGLRVPGLFGACEERICSYLSGDVKNYFQSNACFSYCPNHSPTVTMIVGIENPLLDISVNCDSELLEKYGLEANSAILAGPDHLPLYPEIKQFPSVFYSAGGATQNAMRVAQWMLGGKDVGSRVAYMGCVGNDDNMHKMKQSVEEEYGVKAVYLVDDSGHPTGTCGVLVSDHGKSRSLVANLGAANHFKKSHLEAHVSDILDKAQVIYSSGYFITSASDSLQFLCNYTATSATRPTFAFNLAAPFICEVDCFRDVLMQTIAFVDVLFGNDAEAEVLAKKLGWADCDLVGIAQKLANLEKKGISAERKRIVVITQGSEPTIVAVQGEAAAKLAPIVSVQTDEIVDSNGCGDAYAGAFLAGVLLHRNLDECAQGAAYAACEVIKRNGCTLPAKSTFHWSK